MEEFLGNSDSFIIAVTLISGDKLTEIYSACAKTRRIPLHINTNNGTVLVHAIAYSGKWYACEGSLPESTYRYFLDDINSGHNFNIFACFLISTSLRFSGISQIRSWLHACGFALLPGFIVPHDKVDEFSENFIESSQFDKNLIVGYFEITGVNFVYSQMHKSQQRITHIQTFLDMYGNIVSEVMFKKYSIPYDHLEVLNLSLQVGDYVVVDDDDRLILDRYPKEGARLVSYKYTCPFCGKVYTVGLDSMRCPDPHCLSRMYPNILHFLKKLNLPEFSYDEYVKKYVSTNKIQRFSDVIKLEMLDGLNIEASIFQVLDAIIPVESVRDRKNIWSLCLKCNYSFDSIDYYINHPSMISEDLGIHDNMLINYFSDDVNRKDIECIVSDPKISLIPDSLIVDKAPVLRGLNIYLTGGFRHGSYAEVASILSRFAGTIVDADKANCCLLGDLAEDVNGACVNLIKNSGCPVYKESEFFEHYQLDE